jgi:GTP-binding protein
MLVSQKKLALISSRPGKTQLINHFLVNKRWYLVDLPGYGFAKVSKTSREKWAKMIYSYLENRENLMLVFLLIDSRIPPQQIDLDFIQKLALMGIPFVLTFTKTDKVSKNMVSITIEAYKKILSESWETLPQMFITSAEKKIGREEVLEYIDSCNKLFSAT